MTKFERCVRFIAILMLVLPLGFGVSVDVMAQSATVSGMKFNDLNADGVKDAGEPGLSGWTVYVDYNNDGAFQSATEPSAVTGAGGTYTILGVTPGSWHVREVGQGGWTNSFPATSDIFGRYQPVIVPSNGLVSGIDFGNYQPVARPPTISKAFGAPSIPLNGTTGLTFTIQNPSTGVTLTGIGFTDTLPAGLVVSTPNGLTSSCGVGVITATAGTPSVSLAGATLAASASCTFSVNVIATTAGTKTNTTSTVNSTNGGTGNTASAVLTVFLPIVTQVPTFSMWALMLLAGLLLLAGMTARWGRGR